VLHLTTYPKTNQQLLWRDVSEYPIHNTIYNTIYTIQKPCTIFLALHVRQSSPHYQTALQMSRNESNRSTDSPLRIIKQPCRCHATSPIVQPTALSALSENLRKQKRACRINPHAPLHCLYSEYRIQKKEVSGCLPTILPCITDVSDFSLWRIITTFLQYDNTRGPVFF
jgi:hypothetical protein